MRNVVLAAVVLTALAGIRAARPAEARPAAIDEVVRAHLTYYLPTGYRTASGLWPEEGMIGCGAAFPLGTVLEFVVDGSVRVCRDTGYPPSPYWIDMFAESDADGWAFVDAYATYVDATGYYTDVVVLAYGG